MKTAISVPDGVFIQVGQRAVQLGISRSEFFTRAASRYLADLESQSLTDQINEALDLIGDDDSNAAAATLSHRRLAELTKDDDW